MKRRSMKKPAKEQVDVTACDDAHRLIASVDEIDQFLASAQSGMSSVDSLNVNTDEIITYWQRKQVSQVRQAASSGQATAQYYLGLVYMGRQDMGKQENPIVEKDPVKAAQLMYAAAKQGLSKAILQLYEWACQDEYSARCALLLLAHGNAVVCYWLGQLFSHQIRKDMQSAVKWMKISAQLGYQIATQQLQQWQADTLLSKEMQVRLQDSEWLRLKKQSQRMAHTTVLVRRKRGIKKETDISKDNKEKEWQSFSVALNQDTLSSHALGNLLGQQYTQLVNKVKTIGATLAYKGILPGLQLDLHSSALAQLHALMRNDLIRNSQIHEVIWQVLVTCLPIYQLFNSAVDDNIFSYVKQALACVQAAIKTVSKSQCLMRHGILVQLQIIEKNYASVNGNAVRMYRGNTSVALLGEGYYFLATEIAYTVLDMNKASEDKKMLPEQMGSHTVVPLDGLHCKSKSKNTADKKSAPIQSGKEQAAYALIQLLAQEGLAAAPTILLNVGADKHDISVDTLVQASLTINGLSLRAFLAGSQTLKLWRSRLSEPELVDLIRDIQGGFAWALTISSELYPVLFNPIDLQCESERWVFSEALRHVFETICICAADDEKLVDMQQLQKRAKNSRPHIFRALFEEAVENHISIDEWRALPVVLQQYPSLMKDQSISDCLKQFKHIREIFALFPQTSLHDAIEQVPQLLTPRYLDTHSISALFIGLLLTLAYDAKFENFIFQLEYDVHQQIVCSRIVAIDNDLSFQMPFSQNITGQLQLELKNSLLMLPELRQLTLDERVRKHLLSIWPQGHYMIWISLLAKHDNDYQQWLEQGTLSSTTLDTIDIPVKLPRQVWQFIKDQWQKLCILLSDNQHITLEQCLTHLYPLVDAAYSGLINDMTNKADPLVMESQLYRFFQVGGCCPLTQLLPQGWPKQWENQYADSKSERISAAEYMRELLTQLDWDSLSLHQQWPIVQGLSLLPELTLADWQVKTTNQIRPRLQRWLYEAIKIGRPLVVHRLLQLGAHVSSTQVADETALHQLCICYLDYLDTVTVKLIAKILLGHHSCELDRYDAHGSTPLLHLFGHICQIEHLTTLQYNNTLLLLDELIAHGVNLEAKCALTDKTLLDKMLTIEQPNWDWFEILVNKGAGRDADGAMIVKLAVDHGLLQQPHWRDLMDTLAKRNPSVAWELSQQMWQLRDGSNDDLIHICGIHHGWLALPKAIASVCLPKEFSHHVEVSKPGDDSVQSALADYGKRLVTSVKYKDMAWHIKQFPEMPGISEAVRLFSKQLLGLYVCPGGLFVVFKGYPLWISQTIPGDNFQTVLSGPAEQKNLILSQLDNKSLSAHIIEAMLRNPGDGNADNYQLMPITVYENGIKVKRYHLVEIDYDHAFVPQEQVKSVLFCLENMRKPVHSAVRQRILAICAETFIKKWLIQLIKYQKQTVELFDGPSRQRLFASSWCENLKKGEQYPQTVVTIAFQDKAIVALWDRFLRMQTALKDSPTITHLQLLKRLSPSLGMLYADAFDKFPGAYQVNERFYQVMRARSSYVKDAAYSGALGTSIQAMDAMGLTPQQQQEILTDPDGMLYGPAGAYDQLAQAIAQKRKFETYLHAFNNAEPILETILSEQLRADIVNKIDFGRMKLAQSKKPDIAKQRLILDKISHPNVTLNVLTLQNCAVLVDDMLIVLLKNSPQLTRLVLIDCPYITDMLGTYLAEYAINLSILTLKYLPKLTFLGIQRVNGILNQTISNAVLRLNQLQQVTISDNVRLQSIMLNCPVLIYAKYKQNSALSVCVLIAEHLKVLDMTNCSALTGQALANILKYCQHIDLLNISGCSALNDLDLKKALASYVSLPKINLTNCPGIQSNLWHGIDYIREHAPLYFPSWNIEKWQIESLLLSSRMTEVISYIEIKDDEDINYIALVFALLAHNINLNTLFLTVLSQRVMIVIKHLLALLKINQTIQTLCILGVPLARADVTQLFKFIKHCRQINKLALIVDDVFFITNQLNTIYRDRDDIIFFINGAIVNPLLQTNQVRLNIDDIGITNDEQHQIMLVKILTLLIHENKEALRHSAANLLALLSASGKLNKMRPDVNAILEKGLSIQITEDKPMTIIQPYPTSAMCISSSSSSSSSSFISSLGSSQNSNRQIVNTDLSQESSQSEYQF